jgi:hypothetical protein
MIGGFFRGQPALIDTTSRSKSRIKRFIEGFLSSAQELRRAGLTTSFLRRTSSIDDNDGLDHKQGASAYAQIANSESTSANACYTGLFAIMAVIICTIMAITAGSMGGKGGKPKKRAKPFTFLAAARNWFVLFQNRPLGLAAKATNCLVNRQSLAFKFSITVRPATISSNKPLLDSRLDITHLQD